MKKFKLHLFILSVVSALLLSLPYLVPGVGFLALAGFVPLLFMDVLADQYHLKRFWIWHYFTFVLWNALTTFWVCNATVAGGIFAILANAFQMSIVFGLFRLSKKYLGTFLPYIFLAVMWIAWERFYFDAEISWPWLVLGNAFARTTSLAQWYEYLGTLGGSLWIWASNLTLFFLLVYLFSGSLPKCHILKKVLMVFVLAAVLGLPAFWSLKIYRSFEEKGSETMDVVIAQPNFDPYDKFGGLTQEQQTAIYLGILEKGLEGYQSSLKPVLALAPETFTNDIIENDLSGSQTLELFRMFLQRYENLNLLFGASSRTYYPKGQRPSYNAYHLSDGSWVETHNSALVTDRTGRCGIFHKSKLVIGTEKMPYPKFFSKLDDKLGGVMGRCVGQDEISLLDCVSYYPDGRLARTVPVGAVVCYESVYGEYCTGYVRKGAKALAIITNDAWWGDTPGYRQHLSYASLRAIETRRDIARCANTGISAIINQRGDILQESGWWQEDLVSGSLKLNSEWTFFVQHGDIVGRVCTVLFALILLLVFVRFVLKNKTQ